MKKLPRVHDPIVLIHLGYQRPYARYGFIDRITGDLTYTKLDSETKVPMSWLLQLRKQHPLYKKKFLQKVQAAVKVKPRIHDPIALIHLGYQRPYVKFGFINRATGDLTYLKTEDDSQALVPQSWLNQLRKQHPTVKKVTAKTDLSILGPRIEQLFMTFNFQTTYSSDFIEVKAPFNKKTYGGEVLEARTKNGEVDIVLYPVKDPTTQEEISINNAINKANLIIKEFLHEEDT